jgi:RNA polymerase sigma-70 factor (ECF subfamily)
MEREPERRTDEALCVAVARGDQRALRVLLDRYRDRTYAILARSVPSRADADDLFQELWLRVVRAADDFDPSLRFSSWVYRIAVNLTRDHLRRRAAARLEPGDGTVPDRADEAPGPEAVTAEREESRAMAEAIARLPEGQREVLVLRYFEGLGEAEVASAVGIPPGTVKSRLHHAVRGLRRELLARREEERR